MCQLKKVGSTNLIGQVGHHICETRDITCSILTVDKFEMELWWHL